MFAIYRAELNPVTAMRAIISVGFIAIGISYYGEWSNLMQSMADSVVQEIGADPAKVHERFARMVAQTSADDGNTTGFWDIMFARNGGLGHSLLYVFIFLVAKLAFAVQFLLFTIQQILIQFQIGLAPVFLAFFMIQPLRTVAVRFQVSFVALLLWQLGWAISAQMSNALVDLAATNRLYQQADDFLVGGPHTGFFILVLSLWVGLSTIGAPFIIHKLLTTGANAGAMLLSNVGQALSQGAVYGASAGATVAMNGGSAAATSGAAVLGGAGGAVSGVLGSSGVMVPAAVGVGAALAVSGKGGADYSAKASQLAEKARS